MQYALHENKEMQTEPLQYVQTVEKCKTIGWCWGIKILHGINFQRWVKKESVAELLNGWKPCCLRLARGKKSCSSGGNQSHRVHVQPGRKTHTQSSPSITATVDSPQGFSSRTYPRFCLAPGSPAPRTASCPALLAWWWWRSGTAPPSWWSSPLTQSARSPNAHLLPPAPLCERTPPTSPYEWHKLLMSRPPAVITFRLTHSVTVEKRNLGIYLSRPLLGKLLKWLRLCPPHTKLRSKNVSFCYLSPLIWFPFGKSTKS